MRILIDAMAVGEGRGGIVTYLRGLLRGWHEAGFDDELAVVGTAKLPPEIDEALGALGTTFRLGGAYPGSRFVAQHVGIPALARRWQPDAILATTPVVPLLIWRRPVVAMVHDLRYRHRPAEFRRVQRWYRTVTYWWGIRRAQRLVTNSLMTQQDIVAAYPDVAAKIETIYLGCDLFACDAAATGSHALAFAHWTNKQPDVSIRAWALLNSTIDGFSNILHIVGVSPHDRPRLDGVIDQCGVRHLVQLHDFLDDATYQRLLSSARLLLMPSTFEGFGLPIVEAMRLGVAVVASDNAGMQEAGGAFALYAPADSPEAFAKQCARLLRDDALRQSLVAGGRRHAEQFTWRRTAEQTRETLGRVGTPSC
ncbi:MAG: glycosyltransferase family 4 protein [Thermomicrobiales bacterium]